MNLFAQLRRHAQLAPLSIAVSSRYRPVTYRKLWSRIERATARLQAEWQVGAGDTVAYLGSAHPDALVLYLALLRSGAQLLALPLPPVLMQLAPGADDQADVMQAFKVKRLVYEDHLEPDSALPINLPTTRVPLSALITTRCPHEPFHALDEACLPGLVTVRWSDGSLPISAAGSAPNSEHSSASLCSGEPFKRITGTLFDPDIMALTILPALQAGETLVLG